MNERATDLPGLLADAGINKLKSMRPGHTEKLICPKCGGGRTRETSFSVTIDQDGEGATWRCHRGSCGHTGGGRVRQEDGRRSPPPPREPPPIRKPEPQREIRPKALYEFFDKRGISPETVDHFGCYITKRWFPEHGEQPAIVFPYRWRGEVVNRKYRPPQKNPQLQEKDALPTLFNADVLLDAPEDVELTWVEGEPDVMACHEAGYRYAVTLKDGAPAELRDENDPAREADKRFAALATHAEELGRVKRFILAGDNDEPGQNLREELARRLGRHRCWTVTWPDGCKDAGDVLRIHGADRLQRCLLAAEPWPVEGVQRIRPGLLVALRRQKPPPVLTTGAKTTDAIMRLPGEGKLIVITGIPNHGKTSWLRYVMVHASMWHHRRWLVFSPENTPWERFAAEVAEVFVGKSFYRRRSAEESDVMTDDELAHAENWLADRVEMLVSDNQDEPPTLDWLLDRGKLCVLRDGVTDLVIDPWNELEHSRPERMSETEYVGVCLQRLRAFAMRHGCNVWIVAHPKVQQAPRPGAKLLPPGPYDISGGANWANKTDMGITVHTPSEMTEIHVWKARFARWGRRGTKALLEFDRRCGRYFTPSTADQIADEVLHND